MTERRENHSGTWVDRRISLKDLMWFALLLVSLGMVYQRVLDIGDRQAKYIERRNQQHAEMGADINRLRDEAVERRVWLAAKFGEIVP